MTDTTTTTSTGARVAWSTKNKIGLGLAIFYSATNIPSVAFPTPDGDEGPPMAILIVSSVLAVVGLIAAIVAAFRRKQMLGYVAALAAMPITLAADMLLLTIGLR